MPLTLLPRPPVNGVDIRDLPQATLRAQIALVAQDTHLFDGTVRDNLWLARPDAEEEALCAALDDAAAGAFVRCLPHGLDTVIGERGMKLSGGERQRLSTIRTADCVVVLEGGQVVEEGTSGPAGLDSPGRER